MKITFLGTGAADFSPLLESDYRHQLDLNARRSSAVLLNDTLLIDCGPHVLDSLDIQQLDVSRITDLLLTHLHSDHYDPKVVADLARRTAQPLHIWYREDGHVDAVEHAVLHPLKVGEKVCMGDAVVLPLAANHTACPLHYDITWDDHRLFYGCDGSWVLNDTFYAMMGRQYHAMILDGTVGDYNGDFRLGEHNSIPMLRLMAASFRSQNVVAENGMLIVSHIARTLHLPHAETVQLLARDGFTAAYDGLKLEI